MDWNRILPLCAALLALPACTGPFGVVGDPAPPPSAPKPAPPPTPEQIGKALTLLNEKLRVEYERTLDERGTRVVSAARGTAFDALQASLLKLGMIVESRDPEVGTLTVAAPAPRPLSADEWRETVKSDLPMMAAVLCPVLGAYCTTVKFEPDDYVIAINAVVRATGGGSEVSLTTRMREIVPRPGVPRREYPPPTGVRMALDKIWSRFEQELAERQGQRK